MSLSKKTKDILMQVSTATLTTALFKRGLRNTFLQNVHPLGNNGKNMVGPAFTLRYIPAREDLNDITVFENPEHPQRAAIENCPDGYVLVMDSRGVAEAASGGDILMTRLMKRGAAGVVSDGGFRDSPSIAKLPFPSYHQRPSAPTNLILHQATDINTPIGCGGVPVFPGDIVVGDAEGVVIIPADIADEIAAEAEQMTKFENFVLECVQQGETIIGLYPPTDDSNRERFRIWCENNNA